MPSANFPAAWNPKRLMRRREHTLRYEVTADGERRFPILKSAATAAEALDLARAYSALGMDVYVRDRAQRRFYLTEAMLEALATEEQAQCPPALKAKSGQPTPLRARSRSAA